MLEVGNAIYFPSYFFLETLENRPDGQFVNPYTFPIF